MKKSAIVLKRATFISGNLWGYLFLFFFIAQSIFVILDKFGIYQSSGDLYELIWSIGAAVTGGLLIWQKRDELAKMDKKIWNSYKQENKDHLKSFRKKYPFLSKIPIVGFLAEKWCKEPLIFKLVLIGLSILACCIYCFKLSYYDWLPDEPLVVKAAKGYLEKGSYTKWDYWFDQAGTVMYERAWPHSWMVAQSIKIFGMSLWSTRLISVLGGLFFVPIIYGVSFYFLKNRTAAVLVTIACILHPYFIVYFRRVRMYAVFTPLFVLLYYCCFRVLFLKKYSPKRLYENNAFLKKYLNYDWKWVLLSLMLLYLCTEIHSLAFVIFPIILPTFIYLIIIKKQKRLIPLLVLGLVLLGLNFDFLLRNIENRFVFFKMKNFSYIQNFLEFPFPQYFSFALLCLGLMLFWFGKYQTRIFALLNILGVSVLLYVYCINFPAHFRYVNHLLPLCYMLLIGIVMKINLFFKSKWQRIIIPLV